MIIKLDGKEYALLPYGFVEEVGTKIVNEGMPVIVRKILEIRDEVMKRKLFTSKDKGELFLPFTLEEVNFFKKSYDELHTLPF